MAKGKQKSRTPPVKKKATKGKSTKKLLIALFVVLLLIVTAMGLIHHWGDITGEKDEPDEPGYIIDIDPDQIIF